MEEVLFLGTQFLEHQTFTLFSSPVCSSAAHNPPPCHHHTFMVAQQP